MMAAVGMRGAMIAINAYTRKIQNAKRDAGRHAEKNRANARPNGDAVVKTVLKECAAGEMGIGTAKMAALRGREVCMPIRAFTPTQRATAGNRAKKQVNVLSAERKRYLFLARRLPVGAELPPPTIKHA